MSRTQTSKNPARPAPSQVKTAKDDDTDELSKLDAGFARIKKLLPEAPYFLTVPQDEPRYNHLSRQDAEAWMSGYSDLFNQQEEDLQYATFLYREQGDSCFVCKTAVDEERERQAKLGKSANQDPKKFLQPSAKKRVSLGSYLGKHTNGTAATRPNSNNSTTEEGKKVTKVADSKQSHATGKSPMANGTGGSSDRIDRQDHARIKKSDRGTDVDSDVPSRKRPREDHSLDDDKRNQRDSPQSPKKARRSPPPAVKSSVTTATNAGTSTPHNLPPLLSPINKYDLPPLLSPTLPPNIQQALDELNGQSPSDQSLDTPSSKDLMKPSGPSAKQRRESSPSRSAEFKYKLDVTKPALSDVHKPDPLPARRKLIVKLKYGRQGRRDIERYLKLMTSQDSKRQRSREPPEKHRDSERAVKPVEAAKSKDRPPGSSEQKDAQASATTATTAAKSKAPADKRPRAPEDSVPVAPPTKRHKHNASVELDKNPRTPNQTLSPSASNVSSAQKQPSQLNSIQKESKAVNMLRTSSDPGVEDTPGRSSATPSTSTKASESRNGPTSAPSADSSEVKAWIARSRSLNAIGRSLKHAADPCLNTAREFSLTQRKLAAVQSLECIIAYIAAFAAADYAERAKGKTNPANSQWTTLVPMWGRFQSLCGRFSALEALRLRLGVVTMARASMHYAQQAEQWEKIDETDKCQAASKKHREMTAQVFKACGDARRALTLGKLRSDLPRTWAGQNADEESPEWEDLKPGELELDGKYGVHADPGTTPLGVVRFALKYLEEWTSGERDLADYRIHITGA